MNTMIYKSTKASVPNNQRSAATSNDSMNPALASTTSKISSEDMLIKTRTKSQRRSDRRRALKMQRQLEADKQGMLDASLLDEHREKERQESISRRERRRQRYEQWLQRLANRPIQYKPLPSASFDDDRRSYDEQDPMEEAFVELQLDAYEWEQMEPKEQWAQQQVLVLEAMIQCDLERFEQQANERPSNDTLDKDTHSTSNNDISESQEIEQE